MTPSKQTKGMRPAVVLGVAVLCVATLALVFQFRNRAANGDGRLGAVGVGDPSTDSGAAAVRPAGGRPGEATPGRSGSGGLGEGADTAATTAKGGEPNPAVAGQMSFNSKAKGEQIAEAVRGAIARVESAESPAASAGSKSQLAPNSKAAGSPTAPVAAGRTATDGKAPSAVSSPGTVARSASAAKSPQSSVASKPSAPATGPVVLGNQGRVSGSVGSAGGAAAENGARGSGAGASVGGYTVPSTSLTGAPGLRDPNNAVEAFREGVPVRRAVVEELRQKRVAAILEAREKGGQ